MSTPRRIARLEARLGETHDQEAVRVRAISPHPIIRAGIEFLLAGQRDVVSFAADSRDAPVDAVIYDVIGLHLGDGDELQRAVTRHPDRVLALSRALQPGLTARALDLGAVAAVPISADAEQLLTAVQAAVCGHYRDGSETDLANRLERDKLLGRDIGLTARQRDVLALIVAGRSNLDIASELRLSKNTVKSIIRPAYIRIGVTTRAQAVAWGVEHGFPTAKPPT